MIGETETETTVDRDRWITPRWIIEGPLWAYMKGLDLDPYYDPTGHTKPRVGLTPRPEDCALVPWGTIEVGDGHTHDWTKYDRVWVQPPYSRGNVPKAMRQAKGYAQRRPDGHCIALINCATGSQYWHELVAPHAKAYVFPRRIDFEHSQLAKETSQRNDQAIILFAGDVERFGESFGAMGRVLVPR